MRVVWFGNEFANRAPLLLGAMHREENGTIIGIEGLEAALLDEQEITLRAPTVEELKRFDALAQIYEAGAKMSAALGQLLDHQGPVAIERARSKLKKALDEASPTVYLIEKKGK